MTGDASKSKVSGEMIHLLENKAVSGISTRRCNSTSSEQLKKRKLNYLIFRQDSKQEGEEEGRLDHPQGAEPRCDERGHAAAPEAEAAVEPRVAGQEVCRQPAAGAI